MNIKVEKLQDFPNGLFLVEVVGETNTKHEVVLDEEYYQQLTAGKETPEELISRSFEFLLTREPNTSVLSSFHLKDINRYFPEFEQVISKKTH